MEAFIYGSIVGYAILALAIWCDSRGL